MTRWWMLMAVATLGGCSGPGRVTVDDAWIRLPAVTGRPGVAYFTLEGGPSNATLINVSADIAIRAEIDTDNFSHGPVWSPSLQKNYIAATEPF